MAWQDLSLQCSTLVRSGKILAELSLLCSLIYYRVDGVDQAKFRVPRDNTKTHGTDALIRPALHVQGCWAHGFGFHLAVADPDVKKDTVTNVEVIARMSESIYVKHGALPLTLVVVQDNCARECKNQNILKVFAKMVLLKIHLHVWLVYPEKGHSHGPLDGVFGQCTVKLGNSEFQDDEEVVDLLQGFLRDGSLEPGSRENCLAYKLDNAAEWVTWADEDMELACSNLTGPEAPHSFHICLREHLSLEELSGATTVTAWPGAPPPHGGDLVVAMKSHMSDRLAFQVALLTPYRKVPSLRLRVQPRDDHARRPVYQTDRKDLVRKASKCYDTGAISEVAWRYIKEWSQGTRRRRPRPELYTFLNHRPSASAGPEFSMRAPTGNYMRPKWERRPRLIEALPSSGAPRLDPEPLEDDGDAPLRVLSEGV